MFFCLKQEPQFLPLSHENYLSSKENPSENQSAPFFFTIHSSFFLSKPLPPILLFTRQPTCHLQPLPWPVMLPAMSMQLPQASGRGPPTYLQCYQLLQLVKWHYSRATKIPKKTNSLWFPEMRSTVCLGRHVIFQLLFSFIFIGSCKYSLYIFIGCMQN